MSPERSNSRRPKTAAELMAELQRDPSYLARERERICKEQENIQLYATAAEPLLRDMMEVGFSVSTLGELRHSAADYRAAIPILLRWLPLVSYQPLKEDIVRTLSVPWASPMASHALIQEFERADDPTGSGIRWTIANALEVVAGEEVLDEIIRLAQDPKCGKAREMLSLALGNMSSARVIPVLRALLADEGVVGHAVMALGKLQDPATLPDLEPLTRHPKEWVRQEAQKAIATIKGRPR